MREIKFREWNYKNKKMNYNPIIDTDYINNNFSENNTISIFMQYTGMKDMNETEIYEGDILLDLECIDIGIVTFDNGAFIAGEWAGDNFDHLEVVGNIYENPDILEKEENGDYKYHVE